VLQDSSQLKNTFKLNLHTLTRSIVFEVTKNLQKKLLILS